MRLLASALLASASAAAASAASLTGYAELPADTFTPGPTSGQFISADSATPPFVGLQPVQGFSSLIQTRDGSLLGLSDNGFGAQSNSADALLLIHELNVDFRTETGGAGVATVVKSTPLSDPGHVVDFPIVADMDAYPNGANDIPVDAAIKNNRLLTGADFDIESFRELPDGGFVIGEEFGPFLLYTNAGFEMTRAPIDTPRRDRPGEPARG